MPKRFILVGAGRMGLAHLEAAINLGLTPAGICDLSTSKLEVAAQITGLTNDNCFKDFNELFAVHKNIDLVLIATTADTHLSIVMSAAASKAKAILCEKPMATSVADCDAMIAACMSSGTSLAINHQMRFMDQYGLIKKEFNSNRFGSIGSMNVVAGCIGLSMNGSHFCEAFSWLFESEIAGASATFSSSKLNNPRGPLFFDRAGEIRFVSKNGKRLNLSIGDDQGHGVTVTYASSFGHIFVDELEGIYIATVRKSEFLSMPLSRYGMPWDRWEVRFPQAENVSSTQSVIAELLFG